MLFNKNVNCEVMIEAIVVKIRIIFDKMEKFDRSVVGKRISW